MNDGNADELLSKTNVDGGLIGGASLVAEKFAAIVKAASNFFYLYIQTQCRVLLGTAQKSVIGFWILFFA